MRLADTLTQARACQLCVHELEPRPVLRVSARSRIVIIGQAPGSKVHASGVPWQDPSGDRLIEWLGVDRPTFEDPDAFGILPMGFCYPGKGTSGDKPPPPRCAKTWHEALLGSMQEVRLTLLVGMYAQRHYLGATRASSLTQTVRQFEDYGPTVLPLPHPSWRSTGWMKKNPWFEADILPVLRERVRAVLGG